MGFTLRPAQIRSYFFGLFTLNTRGKNTGFSETNEPNELRFQELFSSMIWKKEAGDRARSSTAGNIEDEVGHVSIAPDAEVLTYTTGLKVDRTTVVHPQQLTEVDEESQNIPLTNDVPEFDGVIIEKNKDGATTTRNKFVPRLTAAFITWLTANVLPRLIPIGGLAGQVLSKIDGTDYNVQWSANAAPTVTDTVTPVVAPSTIEFNPQHFETADNSPVANLEFIPKLQDVGTRTDSQVFVTIVSPRVLISGQGSPGYPGFAPSVRLPDPATSKIREVWVSNIPRTGVTNHDHILVSAHAVDKMNDYSANGRDAVQLDEDMSMLFVWDAVNNFWNIMAVTDHSGLTYPTGGLPA